MHVEACTLRVTRGKRHLTGADAHVLLLCSAISDVGTCQQYFQLEAMSSRFEEVMHWSQTQQLRNASQIQKLTVKVLHGFPVEKQK